LYSFFGKVWFIVTIKDVKSIEEVAVVAGVSREIKGSTIGFPKGVEVTLINSFRVKRRSSRRDKIGVKITAG